MPLTPRQAPASRRPRVYLAGPDVFFRDSAAIFQALKADCERLGMVGLAPSDAAIAEAAGGSDDERAQRIYEGNIRLIQEADGVVANLMCFRGHEPDSGTVFEVGFAVALGKPVVGYGVEQGSYAQRVSAAVDCIRDDEGVLREAGSGVMVEGLGQRLNLMLTRSTALAPSAVDALARLAALLDVPAPGPG
ncbi:MULTISPECIES: nucleoside 2-deoxyribosyltransferase [unclassified Variovorax]|uniref:nucleoside 2-deoxyribosyltransferase n=1 Tax=unclassified Variovorax TaxID=663243 RepID=UPI001BD1C299|nr:MULTISPECIES: nucleoside 2-deoxyribosyltransferase [unclassified Variovorax]